MQILSIKIYNMTKAPKQWKKGLTIPIYGKGENTE